MVVSGAIDLAAPQFLDALRLFVLRSRKSASYLGGPHLKIGNGPPSFRLQRERQ